MAQVRNIVDADDIRSGYNSTVATLAAARVVVLTASGDREIKLPAASTEDVVGVTMAAIAVSEWGDVQIRGVAPCTAAAAITVGDRLMMDTAGKVLTWTASTGVNAAVVGKALTAASADGDLVEVELAGPGVVRQG